MKKLSRILALILCLTMFGMLAMGSGSSSSSDSSSSDSSEEGTIIKDSDSGSTDVTIEEQVLVDQNDVKITATEYTTGSLMGDGIKVLIENNSEQDITVSANALIVNNYMVSDLFYSDVAAGKKANETIDLYTSELNAAGINEVGQVEISFHIYNSDTYDTIFDTDLVTIQTSAYDSMDTTPNDEGTELYNDGGIRIVGKTVDEDSFWGTAILLYIENNSGQNVGISCDDMSINGFMMSPFFSCTVYDGKMALDDITIFSSDLEENDIEKIEDVELSFRIYNADTYSTIKETDPITFSAN